MRVSSSFLLLALAASGAMPAKGQSCVPNPFNGPRLIQGDLNDFRGPVSLGADGLVREAGRKVLFPAPGTNVVEVDGLAVHLTDRIDNGVVWCAASVIAYPTSSRSIRLLRVGSEMVRDFELPFATASFSQMSDGSFWYRLRDAPPAEAGLEWYRLDVEDGIDVVRTPPDAVVIDAYEGMILVRQRNPNSNGEKVVRIIGR